MKSLNQKIVHAFNLSCQLVSVPNSDALLLLTKEETDMVYGHADGLTAKWFYSRRDGTCSIQAMIDFIPEVKEGRLDKQIEKMEEWLK